MNDQNINRRNFLAGEIAAGLTAAAIPRLSFAADETPDAKPDETLTEEGFTPIFDGKTLNGWHTNKEKISHGTGGHWDVEDGAICGEQDPPGNGGMLMTDQSYGDFELILELKPDWAIDSGVFMRTNEKGVCFQCYVDYHDHGNIGWLSTETTSGEKRMIIRPFNFFAKLDEQGKVASLELKPDERPVAWKPDYLLYSATPETWLKTWKLNDWNTLRIRCAGKYPRITTWINNVKMADFDGATSPQPDYKKEDIYKQLGDKGPIALQVHGTTKMWTPGAKCRWRNIRVKTL